MDAAELLDTIAKRNAGMQDDIAAAFHYRESLIEKADGRIGPFPAWHGWVIVEAFLAGMEHQKLKNAGT